MVGEEWSECERDLIIINPKQPPKGLETGKVYFLIGQQKLVEGCLKKWVDEDIESLPPVGEEFLYGQVVFKRLKNKDLVI